MGEIRKVAEEREEANELVPIANGKR